MEIPISKRLLLAAEMVHKGAKVADIGCDHGYLGIYLLKNKIASYVLASDLRPMPLAAARKNAARFATAAQMDFVCADGFSGADPDKVDTLICCGMGGDLIRAMIQRAPWVRDPRYTLILQPQSAQAELRRWLLCEGFALLEEHPILDDRFVYSAMRVQYSGIPHRLTPGEAYVTKQMLACGDRDLSAYIDRTIRSLEKAIQGMEMAKLPDPRLPEYKEALDEILKMKEMHHEGS